MFAKKSQAVELPPIAKKRPSELDSAQLKQLNHEFFLLVRDQKYEQALAIGSMYLQYYPQNQAVQQFCHFIKHNREELRLMVQEENDYTDDSEEEEDEEEQEDSDDDGQSVTSSVSSVSAVSLPSSKASSLKGKSVGTTSVSSIKSIPVKPKAGKENTELCKGHKWDHNCKNKDCPNRKKQQK